MSELDSYDFTINIFYHGHPVATGFGSFNFDEYQGVNHIWTLSEPYGARDWWPCKDDPSDKADSIDIYITVPNEQIFLYYKSREEMLKKLGLSSEYLKKKLTKK